MFGQFSKIPKIILLGIKNYPKAKKTQLGRRCVYPPKNWVKVVFAHKISCLPKIFFTPKNYLSYVLGISIYAQNILGKTCFTQLG